MPQDLVKSLYPPVLSAANLAFLGPRMNSLSNNCVSVPCPTTTGHSESWSGSDRLWWSHLCNFFSGPWCTQSSTEFLVVFRTILEGRNISVDGLTKKAISSMRWPCEISSGTGQEDKVRRQEGMNSAACISWTMAVPALSTPGSLV